MRKIPWLSNAFRHISSQSKSEESIQKLCKEGRLTEALNILDQLNFGPHSTVYACLLRACGAAKASSDVEHVHAHIVRSGITRDTFLQNLLIDVYGRCASVQAARAVFDRIEKKNVYSWNLMISACLQNGHGKEALIMFEDMRLDGIEPDNFTFANLFSACANLQALGEGKLFHAFVNINKLDMDITAQNAVLNMYGKCGSLGGLEETFDRMPKHNVISWTTLISLYTQNGYCLDALELFQKMHIARFNPNNTTFATILDACSSLGALWNGMLIHQQIVNCGIKMDAVVQNALINMYGKCGSLKEVELVFERMQQRNLISWTTIIAAYAQNGCGLMVHHLFNLMGQDGVKPDTVTFISILTGCNHAGMLCDGHHFFLSMCSDHKLFPNMPHYGCMVDILGRAGSLDEAGDVILNMPFDANVMVWMALLAACRNHFEVDKVKLAAINIFQLDPENSVAYVILASIYAAAGY